MKYFSLFSGVGGFELGIEYAYSSEKPEGRNSEDGDSRVSNGSSEWQTVPSCVGFSEIDKHASAVLRYRFSNVKNHGDITKINWSEVPDFDLLVGGSPCQDFSIAGKRAGLAGARSGLFGEYVRALEEKKPAYFIWENVKGVLSSNGGRDFAVILDTLAESGYALWWQVLNAKDFGVPQNRERVFIVGTRNGSPREIFFETGVYSQDINEITRNAPDAQRVFDPAGIGRTLKGEGGGQGAKSMLIPASSDGSAHAIDASYHKGINLGTNGGKSSLEKGKRQLVLNPETRIRRLTPTECERLMSWPDNWTKFGKREDGTVYEQSDTQRYRQCGNGVVSKVVAEIVKAQFN